jgi:translation initiation factor eIF-2B subunit epsilon
MADIDDGGAPSKLQAVILADAIFGGGGDGGRSCSGISFGLQPLSKQVPQILCPLNNVPLLDYIMEFLASNLVEQVIVITAADHKSQHLEEYLSAKQQNGKKSSQKSSCSFWWNDRGGGNLEVLLLKDPSLQNAGDALRELYKRNLVRTPTDRRDRHRPFVLVQGNVVSNVDLADAMAAHRLRNQHDASSLMTTILATTATRTDRPSIVPPTTHLTVGLVEAAAAAAATTTTTTPSPATTGASDRHHTTSAVTTDGYRIFCYDTRQSHTTQVPCSFLLRAQGPSPGGPRQGGGLCLRQDLYDTGIYVCSPDILGKFEDEFDYLHIEEDFIANSVSEEEEGLQTRIHAHVVDPSNGNSRCYAAKITDFASYHAVSRDLLHRWAHPMVPDNRLVLQQQQHARHHQLYKLVVDHTARTLSLPLERVSSSSPPDRTTKTTTTTTVNGYQYKESRDPSRVGRSSICQGPGMTGGLGTIGEDCVVHRCVLGDNVRVGSGCHVTNSHVWDHVVIEDDVTIVSSVIANHVVIRKGAVLPRGCVVGEGCVIGAGVTLKEFTRVTLVQEEDDDDDFDRDDGFGEEPTRQPRSSHDNGQVASLTDPAVVGPDGKGHAWHPPSFEDSDDDDDDDSGRDDDDDDANNRPSKDLWIQLQSIGGDPSEYFQWYHRMQAKAALDHEEDDDDFSDDENDEGFGDGVTESEAFSAFTDGAFTFGDGDGSTIPVISPTSGGGGAAPAVVGRQKGVDVVKEMVEICMEFDDSVFPMENLSIELNSYKFSQNATYSDCTAAATLALLQKMDITPDMKDGRLVTTLKSKLESFWAALLKKMCIGISEEMAIIHALEMAATGTSSSSDVSSRDAVAERLQSGMSFRFILQTLHDEEVLSEEAVLQWAAERKKEGESREEASSPRVRLFQMPPVQDFLEWLEEESSDDDEDDNSGEEEEDSSD